MVRRRDRPPREERALQGVIRMVAKKGALRFEFARIILLLTKEAWSW
jgi:hypothetical protein